MEYSHGRGNITNLLNWLLQVLQGLAPTQSPKIFFVIKYILPLRWNTSANYSKPLYRMKVGSVADF
jgi:hypothetical protein